MPRKRCRRKTERIILGSAKNGAMAFASVLPVVDGGVVRTKARDQLFGRIDADRPIVCLSLHDPDGNSQGKRRSVLGEQEFAELVVGSPGLQILAAVRLSKGSRLRKARGFRGLHLRH